MKQVLPIFPAIFLRFIGNKYTMKLVNFEVIISYKINYLRCLLGSLEQDVSLLGGLHSRSSFSHPYVPWQTMIKYLVTLMFVFASIMWVKISDTCNLTILSHWCWSQHNPYWNGKCNHILVATYKLQWKRSLLMGFFKMENWEQFYFLGSTYFKQQPLTLLDNPVVS